MRLTHKNFFIIEWEYEAYTKLMKDAELKGIEGLHLTTYYDRQVIIGTPKQSQFKISIIGIKWIFTMAHKNDEIFSYIATDEYLASLEERSNDKEELDIMIKSSWKKYSDVYDNRRVLLGITDGLDEIEQYQVDLILEEILSRI